jgi:hypothetical protein
MPNDASHRWSAVSTSKSYAAAAEGPFLLLLSWCCFSHRRISKDWSTLPLQQMPMLPTQTQLPIAATQTARKVLESPRQLTAPTESECQCALSLPPAPPNSFHRRTSTSRDRFAANWWIDHSSTSPPKPLRTFC